MVKVVENPIADKVFEFVEYTNQSIFLTGKAGTGKTTLLKRIKKESTKKMAIVAPTGVAAMNAKGTTINSFFQLSPASYFPGDVNLQNLQNGFVAIKSVASEISYSNDKLKLFRELELLVIDEVSMVRCDVLDVIDAILQKVRGNSQAFGGLQVLLIGDLYQLPPVVKREDWSFLNKAYASPFFFDAYVIKRNPLLQIELTQVFRQTEHKFINILNDIRNNQITEESLAVLNQRYQPDYKDDENIIPIIITSHNAEANAINQQKLDELDTEAFTFEAEINGEFKDLGLQAEQQLILKVGAQIMFIKNDVGEERKFYNGKIGKIKSITNDDIYVAFPGEEDFLLTKSSWQSFEYKLDDNEQVAQNQVGEFLQYPIKLAWAVTIHKSQGLTFDHAIIDAGKSFISGQVYVALSRVRTLEGLILRSKINKDSLRANHEVLNYMRPLSIEDLTNQMNGAQERYILQLVFNYFNFSYLLADFEQLNDNTELNKANQPSFKMLISDCIKVLAGLTIMVDKFQNQLKGMQQQDGFKNQSLLQERIGAANTYFAKEIAQKLMAPILKVIRVKAKNKTEQQIQYHLQKVRQSVDNTLTLMQIGSTLLVKPIESYAVWITANRKKQKVNNNNQSNQEPVTLQLF